MSTPSEKAMETAVQSLGLTTAPRVTPESIDAMIKHQEVITLDDIGAMVLITLHNGLRVLGKNLGSISPENFSMDIAKQKAYEDARHQLWPIAGAILAEDLHRGNNPLTEEQRKLPAHIQRVITEMYQVAARLLGLGEFLALYDANELDADLMASLAQEEVADLREQHGVMKQYVEVLQRRLDRAGV